MLWPVVPTEYTSVGVEFSLGIEFWISLTVEFCFHNLATLEYINKSAIEKLLLALKGQIAIFHIRRKPYNSCLYKKWPLPFIICNHEDNTAAFLASGSETAPQMPHLFSFYTLSLANLIYKHKFNCCLCVDDSQIYLPAPDLSPI